MEKIGLPKINEEKVDLKKSRFVIEPLYPGYGPTIGNALRRALLSSIIGSAATSFKVDGVNHEFSSIPHIKEDMVELLMNLKSVSFKSHSDEPVVIELIKRGPGKVTAADFKPNSNIEIANSDQHLLNLDNKAEFRMEVVVEKDRGFRPAHVASGEKKEIGQISVDASFSPVERVSLDVIDTRVGQITNYDKLILEVTTDGTISPQDALKEASRVLVDHYNAIISDENFNPELTEAFVKEAAQENQGYEDYGIPEEISGEKAIEGKTRIEDINLSPRTTNALINAGVKTLAGLKRLSSLKLEEIKGLGKKGIDEIKSALNNEL